MNFMSYGGKRMEYKQANSTDITNFLTKFYEFIRTFGFNIFLP